MSSISVSTLYSVYKYRWKRHWKDGKRKLWQVAPAQMPFSFTFVVMEVNSYLITSVFHVYIATFILTTESDYLFFNYWGSLLNASWISITSTVRRFHFQATPLLNPMQPTKHTKTPSSSPGQFSSSSGSPPLLWRHSELGNLTSSVEVQSSRKHQMMRRTGLSRSVGNISIGGDVLIDNSGKKMFKDEIMQTICKVGLTLDSIQSFDLWFNTYWCPSIPEMYRLYLISLWYKNIT